jgi:hypothetical protein
MRRRQAARLEEDAKRQAILQQMQVQDAQRKMAELAKQQEFFGNLGRFKTTTPGESIPTPDGEPFTTPAKTTFDRRRMAEEMLSVPGMSSQGMSALQHFEDQDWRQKEDAQKRAETAAAKMEELRQKGLDRLAQIEAARAGRAVNIPAVTPVEVVKDGKLVKIDGRTGRVLGDAPPSSERSSSPQVLKERFKIEDTIEGASNAAASLRSLLQKDPETNQSVNDRALGGGYAPGLTALSQWIPGSRDFENAGVQLENTVKETVLPQLKAIFGGNPTEGERKVLLEVSGSLKLKPEQREEVFKRAIAAADRRVEFNRRRLSEIGGGEQQVSKQEMPDMPPAAQNRGKKIRDTATGQVFQSDGLVWKPLK